MGSTELPHSQASKPAGRALAVLNDHLKLAASTLGVYNIPTLRPNQFPMGVL